MTHPKKFTFEIINAEDGRQIHLNVEEKEIFFTNPCHFVLKITNKHPTRRAKFAIGVYEVDSTYIVEPQQTIITREFEFKEPFWSSDEESSSEEEVSGLDSNDAFVLTCMFYLEIEGLDSCTECNAPPGEETNGYCCCWNTEPQFYNGEDEQIVLFCSDNTITNGAIKHL